MERRVAVLGRYQMKRGVPAAALPAGTRVDTRVHTRHPLRPPSKRAVEELLADPAAWDAFAAAYRAAVARRFAAQRAPFDALAEAARAGDVWLGCSCPTAKNPDLRHCHTWLALAFMRATYRDLEVVFPAVPRGTGRRG